MKKGFPAKDYPRACDERGTPKYMTDDLGHLMPQFRKPVCDFAGTLMIVEPHFSVLRGRGCVWGVVGLRHTVLMQGAVLLLLQGRAAFPEVDPVGSASWAFKRMGYV